MLEAPSLPTLLLPATAYVNGVLGGQKKRFRAAPPPPAPGLEEPFGTPPPAPIRNTSHQVGRAGDISVPLPEPRL